MISSFFNRNSTKESQAGFGLIEAMVALVIFVIGVLGVYKMQLHATRSNALANRVSTATNWAAYGIEELLNKDFADLLDDGTGGSGWNGLNDGLNGTEDLADGAFYILPDGNMEIDGSKVDPADPEYIPAYATYTPPANPLYTILWNVAEGINGTEEKVMNDVKLIRVHVIRNGGIGNGHLYSHDYYKALWPE